jgi:hypothetical protein
MDQCQKKNYVINHIHRLKEKNEISIIV